MEEELRPEAWRIDSFKGKGAPDLADYLAAYNASLNHPNLLTEMVLPRWITHR